MRNQEEITHSIFRVYKRSRNLRQIATASIGLEFRLQRRRSLLEKQFNSLVRTVSFPLVPLGLILVRGLVFVPEINYLSNQILVVFVLYCRKPQALYVVTECEFTNTASNDLRLKANRRLRFSELKLKIKISFHLIQFSAKLTKSTIEKLISAFTEKGKREFYG